MYRAELEKDLKQIFGIKKVVFSSVEYGQEQDVIYCSILRERNRPRHGFYYFYVYGSIGYNAQVGNTVKGFWHAKFLRSRYATKSRLSLSSFEDNVDFTVMNKFFNKSRIDFQYRIKIPFDPSGKTKGFVSTIMKLLKIKV